MDLREIAKACRVGAKMYEAFKAGEEFASQLDGAEHLIANAQSELARLNLAVEAARANFTQTRASTETLLQETQAKVATLLVDARDRVIPAERERALADLTSANVVLARQRDELTARIATVIERESEIHSKENRLADERQAFAREEAKLAKLRAQLRDEAQKAISVLSS